MASTNGVGFHVRPTFTFPRYCQQCQVIAAGYAGAMQVKFFIQGNTTTGVAAHSRLNTVGSIGAM